MQYSLYGMARHTVKETTVSSLMLSQKTNISVLMDIRRVAGLHRA